MSNNELQQRWINTPFAYTRLSKNLSLLQQDVLIKVSDHLQKYIQEFYGSDLKNSSKIPQPLFSEAVKNSGISQFHISYAELGVSVNNYFAASKAVEEVLGITITAPGIDKDGKKSMVKYNVFVKGTISSADNNGVVFGLNMEVVDYVFNMAEKYVRHPDDIAKIGNIERMPMMYYLLQHETQRWSPKRRIWKLSVDHIKKYLGMIEENEKGERTKEAYPKFSQFRKNVLDTSIEDINRLKRADLLDICVSYEPVYNGKRKVGNPAYIKFRIFDTIEEMERATATPQQTLPFADNQGQKEWQDFLSSYNGSLLSFVSKFSVHTFDGTSLSLSATAEDIDAFETEVKKSEQERLQFLKALYSSFGKSIHVSFYVPKQ